ncbi:MAG: Hsp20/alpha crystallin family protein [bacterium]|nr:Hsp20/alpha crystallin family protein [Phycisphaerales bacterium]MCE2652840.1 Hsp20/alpha crystallin family protein [Planctomycetaceae bacterium]
MNLSLWKKRDPLDSSLARLRQEMDRTFDRFFSDPSGMAWADASGPRFEGWLPPLDISQTDAEITIRAEVPGVAVKDLAISVSGNTLTIAGHKAEHREQKEEDIFRCERRFGEFRRSVELPETADPEKITAESDNGVITIRILRRPGAKPRLVEIKPIGRKVPVNG